MSVQTVLGSIPVAKLGITLTHEHLSIKFNRLYTKPPERVSPFLDGDLTLRNLGFVRQYPYSSKINLELSGSEVEVALLTELKFFKECGGGTIIENTTHGIGRQNRLLVNLSQATGVNIIAGTGHYIDLTQSESVRSLGVEEIMNIMRQEITVGCSDCPEVRCGFIGEVGSSWPITDFEKRCIQATGELQNELGVSVSFHPGRDVKAPTEILRVYLEAGGNKNKAVMSHLDRTISTDEDLLEFAQIGSFCQFDLFGTEVSYYQFRPDTPMPSDAQRMAKIKCLVDNGYSDKILMSHDIHTRHRLMHFGGHGYSHILCNVVPTLSTLIGEETVKKIMTKNPQTWLNPLIK